LFAELRESGVEFEHHSTGMVVAALTEEGVSEYAAMLHEAQAAGYDEPVRVVDGDELRRLEPAASDAVVGGVHAPSEQYVRPESLAAGLAGALRQHGARVEERTAVERLAPTRAGWRVETTTGAHEADAVVVAAGAWSGRLLAGIVDVPMEAAKGYSLTARGEGTAPRHAFYLAEGKVGCSTFGDALRIAGVFDLSGIDSSLKRRRLAMIGASAAPYLRDWKPTDVELEWAGLRPYPPDGLPIVGSVPRRDGLYIATGHGRLGITLAPATGKAIRSLVVDGRTPDEIRPFGVERFAGAGAREAAAA
ncbi:MAG: FAD-binding oxidoreductase, partial [Actinobacteria bacterium]|nr:FAD-binding oxidoreductase [Actinomycetota bacterium]